MANSKRLDPVAEHERDKYTRMWADASYRVNSPGLNAAPEGFKKLGCSSGETLIDYGCGEARSTAWFKSQGLDAQGVDLVQLKPDVIQACLWDLPKMSSDYAYCAGS